MRSSRSPGKRRPRRWPRRSRNEEAAARRLRHRPARFLRDRSVEDLPVLPLGPLLPLLFGSDLRRHRSERRANRGERPVVAVIAASPNSPGSRPRASGWPTRSAPTAPFGSFGSNPRPTLERRSNGCSPRRDPPVQAVLTGIGQRPRLIGDVRPDGNTAGQLNLILADAAARPAAPPSPLRSPRPDELRVHVARPGA